MFLNYAGIFSREIWLNCIYPHLFRCCPQLKLKYYTFHFRERSSLLPYIVTFIFFVQFSRCNFQPRFAVRFEDPTSVRSSNPAAICLVGPSGLEPPTLRLSVVRSSQLSYGPKFGGDYRDRTGDLLLARQALSQLS